jgi:hypothetical protein
MKAHTLAWMALPGVVGTAIRQQDGRALKSTWRKRRKS